MIANLKKNKKKGFTLVELIVVIAIIAIIAAVAVPTTISYVNKAKISTADQEATELMNTLNTAMTDLALNAPAGGVTADEFGKLLTSVMPEVEHVKSVVVNATTLTAVKITVITDVEAPDDDTAYSDASLGGKVGAVKVFNWKDMGITAAGSIAQVTFTHSGSGWTANNAGSGDAGGSV